jgi:myo-inositol 2-dehydrogenase/D-chiro-inositol 1-dehydrogenase
MSTTVKIGLIGFGRIGKIHFNNIQQRIPEGEIIIVSDPVADFSGISVAVGSVDDVISHPDVEAVILCSPTDTHADYVEKAALSGKHIFCEKPLDLSLERIIRTLELVDETGVKLMLGFNRRFDANFLKIKNLVNNGDIGEPQLVKVTSRDPGPPPLSYLKESGGMFLDMTIHDFDMARYIMGKEVKQVYASAAVFWGEEIKAAEDIDTAVITLKFEDDSMAVIDNSRKAVYGYDQRLEVFGSKGMVNVDNNKPDNHFFYNEKGVHSALPLHFFLERYTESYLSEMREFISALQNDKPVSVGGEDALKATLIALAAKKSVQENRPVTIEEIKESLGISI